MTINFKLDETFSQEIQAPGYETAKADFAPYYNSGQKTTEISAQSEISLELGKLGSFMSGCFRGEYLIDDKKRYGYKITFLLGGRPGVIYVAGLHIEMEETDRKKHLVRIQALKNVRDWLKAAVTAKVFSPAHSPLLPHMLLPDGKTTVGEYIEEYLELPHLLEASNSWEG